MSTSFRIIKEIFVTCYGPVLCIAICCLWVSGCHVSARVQGDAKNAQETDAGCQLAEGTKPCAVSEIDGRGWNKLTIWVTKNKVVAQVYRASPSTDWEQWTSYCFGVRGELVALDMRLVTRHGNAIVNEHIRFEEGKPLTPSRRTVKDLFSFEPRPDEEGSYLYVAPEYYKSIGDMTEKLGIDCKGRSFVEVCRCLSTKMSR